MTDATSPPPNEAHSLENRLNHECFPQPSSSGALVWRYITLAKLVSLLETKSLFLCRLDLFDDAHEGSLPQGLALARDEFLRDHNVSIKMSEITMRHRQSMYVNCWNLSEFESEALWRLYGTSEDGVAIRAKYSSLTEAIRNEVDMFVGKVTYIDYETEWFPAGNLFYPIMHKRRAFAHEQEVRIVKWLHAGVQQEEASKPQPMGLSLPVQLDQLVEGLYVSPYCPQWYADVVKSVVDKYAPSLADTVQWSPMKAIPRF